jgi:hypothetical protein
MGMSEGTGHMNNTLRPELRLLLHCARTRLETQRANQIKSLVENGIEWTYLIRMALGHGVMPLLYWTLHSTCPDAVPRAVLEQLQGHFYANAGHNLLLTKELLKLLHLLDGQAIPAIPYKGPVLAASIYGNVTFREFGDLDILVRERDYKAVQHLLLGQGYRLIKEFDWESTLVDASGKVAVDLHKKMTPREFSSPLDFDYLSGRLQRIAIAGTEVPTLSPGDTLLMLAIQITKDSGSPYFQLAKICDIAELLRTHPHLDWEQILRQARRLGGKRMLLYSLRLANNLLGTVLPQEIVSEMRFHPALVGLVEYAGRQLFSGDDRTISHQPTIDQFRWLVRERLWDKLYPYYLRYVVANERDRGLLPLPKKLSFIYYFIRPVRLIGKYGLVQIRRTLRSPINHDVYGHDKKTPNDQKQQQAAK